MASPQRVRRRHGRDSFDSLPRQSRSTRHSFIPAGTNSTAISPTSALGSLRAGVFERRAAPVHFLGNREYWNARDGHYLGPSHDAVPVRVDPATLSISAGPNPLDRRRATRRLRPGGPAEPAARRRTIPIDPALAARIESYELAFRMQRSLPEVMNFAETAETRRSTAWTSGNAGFRHAVLALRRLVERGVRFIQVQHGASGAEPGTLMAPCAATTAATLGRRSADRRALEGPERRGLLDETIVVFATEFGRTPGSQNSDGRDHHIYGSRYGWRAAASRGHNPRRDRRDRLPRRRASPLCHRRAAPPYHAPARPRFTPSGVPPAVNAWKSTTASRFVRLCIRRPKPRGLTHVCLDGAVGMPPQRLWSQIHPTINN